MKANLFIIGLACCLCLVGCQSEEPEPDFSGLKDISYTVQASPGMATSSSTVSVGPNPFINYVEVHFNSSEMSPATVYFSDEKGKYTKKIDITDQTPASVAVDFSNMPKGVYLCEVHQQNKVSRYRLIKAE